MAAGKWPAEVAERLNTRTVMNGDCAEFAGARTTAGYGSFYVGMERRVEYAHRVSYEISKGEIPPGYDVDHLCRNPACIRPDHLEAVPHRENVLRGLRGRMKTHCAQGHAWIEENIYTHRGRRSCLICRNTRNAAWNAAHKRQET